MFHKHLIPSGTDLPTDEYSRLALDRANTKVPNVTERVNEIVFAHRVTDCQHLRANRSGVKQGNILKVTNATERRFIECLKAVGLYLRKYKVNPKVFYNMVIRF